MDILLPLAKHGFNGRLPRITNSFVNYFITNGNQLCGTRLHKKCVKCLYTNFSKNHSCILQKKLLTSNFNSFNDTHLCKNNTSLSSHTVSGFQLPSYFKSTNHVVKKNEYFHTREFSTLKVHNANHCDNCYSVKKGLYQLLKITVRSKSDKIDLSQLPDLNEEDLEEYFVRGSGPGGQATNKTANCVRLFHKPTGLSVKNHETRSLEDNRKRARLQLKHKLDFHLNGENSLAERTKRENSRKKLDKKKKTKERQSKLKAFKEREHIS